MSILIGCQIKDINNISKISVKKNTKPKIINNDNNIKYVVGDNYFIEGVNYKPEENYNYNKIGLASFYGKELHNKKTINNDFNKVTELLGRHKTLPIPSIVKITNLDNGLSLILKINDRHNDNSTLIQVSRKAAQLLRFYQNKIAKVRIEVLPDPSKQMKIVTLSMNEKSFNDTIDSAPTEFVSISNLNEEITNNKKKNNSDDPILLSYEKIENKDLFLKINGFKTYDEFKKIINELKLSYKYTFQNESGQYNVLIGPLSNMEANNLVLTFISKGYKKNEFILE